MDNLTMDLDKHQIIKNKIKDLFLDYELSHYEGCIILDNLREDILVARILYFIKKSKND